MWLVVVIRSTLLDHSVPIVPSQTRQCFCCFQFLFFMITRVHYHRLFGSVCLIPIHWKIIFCFKFIALKYQISAEALTCSIPIRCNCFCSVGNWLHFPTILKVPRPLRLYCSYWHNPVHVDTFPWCDFCILHSKMDLVWVCLPLHLDLNLPQPVCLLLN